MMMLLRSWANAYKFYNKIMHYHQHFVCFWNVMSIVQNIAYFWVQLRPMDSYLFLSVLYMWAISGTRGSSGLGSVSSEHIDSKTCIMQIITLLTCILLQLTATSPAGKEIWKGNKDFMYIVNINDLWYGKCRTPLIFEYVQTDVAVVVYIRVENFGPEGNLPIHNNLDEKLIYISDVSIASVYVKFEAYLGRFKRIVRWEMDGDLENTTRIGAIIWTNYGCLPMEHILCNRPWNSY